jgi:lysophospholipid acyltransferase (LPLAT)-like uncharacterized protein
VAAPGVRGPELQSTTRGPWVLRTLMAALGILVGLVARLWLATLRVEVTTDPTLPPPDDPVPWVMGFWHGLQWPLFAYKRRRPTVVLVSLSRDGSLQARALALQGLSVVRGSSSRGGARGLVGIVRALRNGADAAFAVDGPKGPLCVVKGGVVAAAQAAGARLIPVGAAIAKGLVLTRAWDRYAIAFPFSRVEVVLGAPIDANLPTAREELQAAILRANAEAKRRLSSALRQRRHHGDRVDLDLGPAG